MSTRVKKILKYFLIVVAVYGNILQWPLYLMGFFGGKVAAACWVLGMMAAGFLFSRNSLPDTPELDRFTDKYGKYGCLTLILVFVTIYILFFRVDEIYYRTFYDPITYCDRFPHGKHIESAMYDVLNGLRNEHYYYDKFEGSQRRIANFCDRHNDIVWSKQIRTWGDNKYKELRDDYFENAVYQVDMEALKRRVEDKYYPEIDEYCQKVTERWANEPSAWSFVCKLIEREKIQYSRVTRYKVKSAIEMYLEYHPRGKHALEAYELRDEYTDEDE